MRVLILENTNIEKFVRDAIESKKAVLFDRIQALDREIAGIDAILRDGFKDIQDVDEKQDKYHIDQKNSIDSSENDSIDKFKEIDKFEYTNLKKNNIGKTFYYKDKKNYAISREGYSNLFVWTTEEEIQKMKKMDTKLLQEYISELKGNKRTLLYQFIEAMKDDAAGMLQMLNTQTRTEKDDIGKIEGVLEE